MQDVLGISRDGESSIPSQDQQNIFVQKGLYISISIDFSLKSLLYRATQCGPALEGGERDHLGCKSQMEVSGRTVGSYHGEIKCEDFPSKSP